MCPVHLNKLLLSRLSPKNGLKRSFSKFPKWLRSKRWDCGVRRTPGKHDQSTNHHQALASRPHFCPGQQVHLVQQLWQQSIKAILCKQNLTSFISCHWRNRFSSPSFASEKGRVTTKILDNHLRSRMAMEKMAPSSQCHFFTMENSGKMILFYTDSISQLYRN